MNKFILKDDIKNTAFIDRNGQRYNADLIRTEIKSRYPELKGYHVSIQLTAIGLIKAFQKGETPNSLPYTFY